MYYVYGNLYTEGEAWVVQIYIYTDNEVYNRFKLHVNDPKSLGLCNSPLGWKKTTMQATEVSTGRQGSDQTVMKENC